MADDNTIIEGTVKFRDGKKWKSRWCVMRRLSPVADCVHLQVYRDSRARWAGAASKASLSLQQYLGCEAGFTLDKHSHTLALLCADFTAVLAFETRERLMQWQVKLGGALGEARQFLVVVAGGRRAAGPARLHLLQRRFALAAGVPPRLLGVWDLAHLRRFGVADGRFCFEGGSHCGKGEGLHVLVTDQATEIARDFDLALRGQLSPRRRPLGPATGIQSPDSNDSFKKRHLRRLELNTIERSLPPTDLRLYEDPCTEEDIGAISPYWPSAERTHFQDMGLGDTASVNETVDGTDMTLWNGNGNVMLERCMSCISKLGALSRSSTAALTPGAKHFSPAWTMEAVDESRSEVAGTDASFHGNAPSDAENGKTEEICRCSSDRPPDRPPKPVRLRSSLTRKPPMPLPIRSFSHSHLVSIGENNSATFGPYENYDVPKIPSAEVEGEYYDTPKRLKECINSELFRITKNSTSNTLILKKPCGCLLKLGKKMKRPTVIDTDDTFVPTSCPCRRVTDWANNWIKLPYCKRSSVDTEAKLPNKENVIPDVVGDANALYATVDLTRKTRRKIRVSGDASIKSVEAATAEVDESPLANYENLNFALSLEHYENAKDLLRRAGVTQIELDALGANLRSPGASLCVHCGHPRVGPPPAEDRCPDEYLLMEPSSLEGGRLDRERAPPAGYAPMSPIGSFGFHALGGLTKGRLSDEKSASDPSLRGPEEDRAEDEMRTERERPERRQRSSSADSSRFLDDTPEFEGGASSAETLRESEAREPGVACLCAGKHSDADSSEAGGAGHVSAPAGNRDSSSSNDSGVSSWSLRGERAAGRFELPPTTAAARRRYRSARRAVLSPHTPRRSRSTGGGRASPPRAPLCRSAEAEVPAKPLRGVVDTHSTSSGTSDMSDYIETLSICSSHSSSDTPITMRVVRHTTSTLRPRSGNEYRPLHLAARPH